MNFSGNTIFFCVTFTLIYSIFKRRLIKLRVAFSYNHISRGSIPSHLPGQLPVFYFMQGIGAYVSVLISELIQQSESRLITLEQELLSIQENLRRKNYSRYFFSSCGRHWFLQVQKSWVACYYMNSNKSPA